ncbi:MAG: CoA transferase [Anaerolineae bacterium]|nr:MAG: CoA transferase [Anaerolineae bacterium]
MPQSPALLQGIRVIDLTRVLAGPYCTMMLGDLGADVIKIESPGKGDDTRGWGPPFTEGGESAYFLSANRNKRSITLNLKSEAGLNVLRDLIREGDVLVENFKTGTLERLGLSYKEMQALRPGLIYCTITGYGTTGPLADLPGYDFIAQALGGMMAITGPEDGEPYRVGVAITDLMTGIFACNAILAALFARQHTGAGQRIDMALLDSQVATLSYVASNYLVSRHEPKRLGNAHPNIVPYQSFRASDKYFAVAAGNDGQWAKLTAAMGKPEWATDERFATNAARVKNREVIVPLLAEAFTARPAAEWMEIFDVAGIPAAPINSIREVFEHEQVVARERVRHIPHPTAGTIPQIASPMNFPDAPLAMRLPPPLVGQHNAEVLAEVLGYGEDKIAALREDGLV